MFDEAIKKKKNKIVTLMVIMTFPFLNTAMEAVDANSETRVQGN